MRFLLIWTRLVERARGIGVRRNTAAMRLPARGRLAIMAVALAMPGLAWCFGLAPDLVEQVYTRHVGRLVTLSLARITAPFPFSLFEFLVYFVLARLLILGGIGMADGIRRKRLFRWVIYNGFLRVATTVAVIVILFYVNWGFNFARPELIDRMGWERYAYEVAGPEKEEELAALCTELVDKTNQEYRAVFGMDDRGQPTRSMLPLSAQDDAVERGYARAAPVAGLPAYFGVRRAPAKPVLASGVMSRLMILGIYSPFTGEANFNRYTPECSLPQVLGHEKAHQRLVANESEANFFGYLAAVCSDDAYTRYSGYLFAQRQLLAELLKVNPSRAKDLLERRTRGVQRDVDSIRKWIDKYYGAMGAAGRAANDAYLRANRVKEGIQAYQAGSRFIITFARMNGGSAVVNRSPEPRATPH